MDEIPVNIISGFLGSGKTTAIIKLLSQKTSDDRWAVIINEFGKISIDSQTIRSTSSTTGTVFDISGGCICCSAKGYFQENLEKITGTGDYSRILIEPSGLGGIEMVTDIVNASAGLHLMPVICLVDITMIENLRLQRLPIYRTQILKAGLIVFSKCDLLNDPVREDHLIELFKSMYPDKQISRFMAHNIPVSWLSENDIKPDPGKGEFRMILQNDRLLTDDHYLQQTCRFEALSVFVPEKVIRFFTDYPKILRAKGHIRTLEGWKLFNYTLTRCSFEPCEAKGQSELIIISEKSPSDLNENPEDTIREMMIANDSTKF